MSRSFTNGAIKGHSDHTWAKKVANSKFRAKSKKDPENIIHPKKQGYNIENWPESRGRYAGGCCWCTYKSFCK